MTYVENRHIRFDYEHRAVYRMSLIAGLSSRILLALYGKLGKLPVAQWRVLSVIGEYGPISATDVAGRTSLERDKVSRAVENLVGAGLVIREVDPDDRRYVILTLSGSGRRLNDKAETARNAMEAELLAELAPEELDTFYSVLARLDARVHSIAANRSAWDDIVTHHLERLDSVRPA